MQAAEIALLLEDEAGLYRQTTAALALEGTPEFNPPPTDPGVLLRRVRAGVRGDGRYRLIADFADMLHALDRTPLADALKGEGLLHSRWRLELGERSFAVEQSLREERFLYLRPLQPAEHCRSGFGSETASPFRSIYGAARLRLVCETTAGTFALALEPLLVLKPAGPEARRMERLARALALTGRKWLTPRRPDAAADGKKKVDAPEAVAESDRFTVRRRLLERVLSTYEELLPFFRSHARCRPRAVRRVAGVEQMKRFTHETAVWIATHPDALVESRLDTGIRVGSRAFLPQSTLVDADRRDPDLPENRIVLGFLAAVERELADEIRRAEGAIELPEIEAPPGYVSTGGWLGEAEADASRERLALWRELRGRLMTLRLHYRAALPIEEAPVAVVPEATHTFLSITPYRRIYDLIREWRADPGPALGCASLVAAFLAESRLTEICTLLATLEGLEHAGFELIESESLSWAPAGGRLVRREGFGALADRFRMRSPSGTIVTLWYEPVVRTPERPLENGLELARTSSLLLREGGLAAPTSSTTENFWHPDFVVEVAREGGSRWLLADAKAMSPENALRLQGLQILFKYLYATTPRREQDRIESVWLLCAEADAKNARTPCEVLNLAGSLGTLPAVRIADAGLEGLGAREEDEDALAPETPDFVRAIVKLAAGSKPTQ